MLIYLDANVVQYCADYEDFVFGDNRTPPKTDTKLLRELEALRLLGELDQLGEGWDVAAPPHLMQELVMHKSTPRQRKVYEVLVEAWRDFVRQAFAEVSDEKLLSIERSLRSLNLKDADRRHLAEAIAWEASWFVTNDREIIRKTRRKSESIGHVQGVLVALPSECIEGISSGLFLR